jgi:predicted transposase/invertase (TIGR01784 family)
MKYDNFTHIDLNDLPERLPAYNDRVFKLLFTHPEAKLALKDLLSSLLGMAIESLEVKSENVHKDHVEQKDERFDVQCLMGDGSRALVEMQASPMKGDNAVNEHKNLRCRSVYGLCDVHSKQAGRGVDYADFARSYHVTICNYKVFGWKNDFAETFTLRNENARELSSAISAIYVDLTKVKELIKVPIENLTPAQMWGIFLKYANEPRYTEKIRQIALKREGIKVANSRLTETTQDVFAQFEEHSKKMAQMDRWHNEAIARKEGRNQVLQIGKLHQLGADADDIARQLNMNVSEVSDILDSLYK